MTEEEKKQVIREHYSQMAKRCLTTMTPEARKQRATIAVQTRWKNYKLKKQNNEIL
jgi:hypothetical protein